MLVEIGWQIESLHVLYTGSALQYLFGRRNSDTTEIPTTDWPPIAGEYLLVQGALTIPISCADCKFLIILFKTCSPPPSSQLNHIRHQPHIEYQKGCRKIIPIYISIFLIMRARNVLIVAEKPSIAKQVAAVLSSNYQSVSIFDI